MKRSIFIIAVLTFFVILTNITFASDVDDMKAVVQNLYKALNNADAKAYAKCVLPEATAFANRGLLAYWFSGTTTLHDVQNLQQSRIDAGTKFNVILHHLDAKVNGNSAVATYYRSGTIIRPNGDIEKGMFSGTAVCIKQSGKWKIAHFHISPLQTE
jgi:ketosteroid isomerase-like protein